MAEGQNNGEKYWKRVGHISINGVNYGSDDNALDFRFRIRKVLAAQRFEASIDILGLSLETIHELTMWQPWNVSIAKERTIEVYAGYEDEGEKLLFSGYIYEARPTNPPNMWLNIKADNLSFLDKKLEQGCKRGKCKFKKYLKELVDNAYFESGKRLALKIASDVENKDLYNPYYNSTLSTLPQYIESLHDVFSYIDNGCLYVVNRNPKEYPTMRGIYVLNVDTGLLGIGKYDYSQIEAKMRLDTRFGMNDFIWIQSELYPENATGAFLVNEVEYNGHLRGQEWETVIHAWNHSPEAQKIRSELDGKSGK